MATVGFSLLASWPSSVVEVGAPTIAAIVVNGMSKVTGVRMDVLVKEIPQYNDLPISFLRLCRSTCAQQLPPHLLCISAGLLKLATRMQMLGVNPREAFLEYRTELVLGFV